jgi:hypothetical protein
MKKVAFIFIILCSTVQSFSQTDATQIEKPLQFGFNLGLNYSNFIIEKPLPQGASITNGPGFRLGILAEYKTFKALYIAPKAELSFNGGRVNFANPDNLQSDYDVMPISLDLITHFVFKKKNNNLSPYFFVGPNVKIPIQKKIVNSTQFGSTWDLAIDFGVGLDKHFTNLNFAPELRYTFGLRNVNQNPLLKSINFHNVSLVFNFKG